MTVTRVAVVSQASLPREAWKALLSVQPGIQVLGDAATPEALTDLALPEGSGSVLVDSGQAADVVRRLLRLKPGWGALVLVDVYNHSQIVKLIRAGATGVVSRDERAIDLVSALVAVARGELVLPPAIAGQVLMDLLEDETPFADREAALSVREADVLQLLAQGMTNKLIAQQLLLSVRTVEAHLRAIYDKLGVASRTEAVLWAVRHGHGHPD